MNHWIVCKIVVSLENNVHASLDGCSSIIHVGGGADVPSLIHPQRALAQIWVCCLRDTRALTLNAHKCQNVMTVQLPVPLATMGSHHHLGHALCTESLLMNSPIV